MKQRKACVQCGRPKSGHDDERSHPYLADAVEAESFAAVLDAVLNEVVPPWSPPEMHPVGRDLDRLAGIGASATAGLTAAIHAASAAEVEELKDRALLASGVVRPELLRQLVEDARQQLDNLRGTATLMHRSRDRVDQAVAGWRQQNPGLSRLLDLTTER